MYVAVKGGEKAINNAHELLAEKRRGDIDIDELSIEQIQQQMSLAVDRVMTEGSLYDPELAALAIKQASGDITEAIFLLRAYRTTLSKFAYTEPVDTCEMRPERRISAAFKDIPGGQLLGPTYDYTHRLLDFTLLANGEAKLSESDVEQALPVDDTQQTINADSFPHILELLNQDGLIEPSWHGALLKDKNDLYEEPADVTRDALTFPADRTERLQILVRGDEGFLLAMAYSTQRGYGRNHAFAGEIRSGEVSVSIVPEELGFAIDLGDIVLTECEMINQFVGSKTVEPTFTRGYGVSFGFSERKAMAMAMVDRALRAEELGEVSDSPAQDEEFILGHCDNVEAVGFVSHLKLPHYVDFQSELELVRKLRSTHKTQKSGIEEASQSLNKSSGENANENVNETTFAERGVPQAEVAKTGTI